MASDQSWTPSGLEPEVEDALREAAYRRGLTVSEWLQEVIRESAGANATPSVPDPRRRKAIAPSTPFPEAAAPYITPDRLTELARQIELASQAAIGPRLPNHNSRAAAERPGSIDQSHEISAALAAIERRLAALDSRPGSENAPSMSQARSSLPDRPAAVPDRSRGLDPAPKVSEDGVESGQSPASGSIAQESCEDTPRRDETAAAGARAVEGLQQQLQALTDEVRSLRERGGEERFISLLRQELSGIGNRLKEAAPRRDLHALLEEVQALARRVDGSQQQGSDSHAIDELKASLSEIHHSLQRMAPAEALDEFRREVRAIDRKIESLGSGDRSALRGTLQELAQAIAELREIAARTATGGVLGALAEEVQAIRAKLDTLTASIGQPHAAFSDMLDEKFRALEERFGLRRDDAGDAPEHVTRMVEELAHRLDRVDIGQDWSQLLDSIAQQVSRLTEYIEASDARMETLDQFDRGFRDLLGSMAEIRASTLNAAEQIARETAAEASRQSPDDVQGLRSDLNSLRENQEHSDRRTQGTLEAVHDTLERLVDRLAIVETRMHLDRVSDVEAPPSRAASAFALAPPLQPSSAAQPAGDDERQSAAQSAGTPAGPPAQVERAPLDPTLPADFPLEPGVDVSRVRSSVSAAERIAASEAALGPARPVQEADAKANFIAAARRAAQAAANMAPPQGAMATLDEKRAASTFASLAQRLGGRRSALLLIALISGGAMYAILSGSAPQSAIDKASLSAVDTKEPVAWNDRASASSGAQPIAAPAAVAPSTPASENGPAAPTAGPTEPASPTTPIEEASGTTAVSPLAISSIQLPNPEFTGSIGRPSELAAPNGNNPPAWLPTPLELPEHFSQALRAAALAGDPAAEYEVAVRHAEGRDTRLNYEAAIQWFERAASRGLAPAQYRLGSLYEKGNGTRKDLERARRLYRAAADQGNGKAMHNLAVLYAEGIDGKPDLKSAAEWFRKAANHGIGDSQYNLGILYARGLGVEQNLAESFKWFALAAKLGDQDAANKRDDVAARLQPQQLVAARLAVQTFTPEPQPESAVTVKGPEGGWDAPAAAAPAAKPKPLKPRRNRSS